MPLFYLEKILGTQLAIRSSVLSLNENPTRVKYRDALLDRVDFLKEDLKKYKNFIKRVEMIALPPNKDLDVILHNQQAEMADLQAAISKASSQLEPPEKKEANSSTFEQKEKPVSSKIQKLCKKLFYKIVLKTHPDKTKDESKHALYRASVTAYEAFDLDTLKMIWDSIKGGSKKSKGAARTLKELLESNNEEFRLSLEDEIDDLEKQIERIQQSKQILENSEFSRVVRAYLEGGDSYAIEIYKKILELSIAMYSKQLALLRKSLRSLIKRGAQVNVPQATRVKTVK